jgi:hypothetical protein
MVAVPALMPLTVGCVTDVVAPWAMNKVDVERVALAELDVVNETNTPPAPAGCESVTGSDTWLPMATDRLDGIKMSGFVTVTVALAPETFAALLVAPIVAVPRPTAVTVTLSVADPAGIVTFEGTVATAALLVVRFTTRPPVGAGADKRTCRVPVAVRGTLMEFEPKLNDARTCTVWVAEV